MVTKRIENNPMTAGELIEKLRKYHSEAVVKLMVECIYPDGTGSFEEREITRIDTDYITIPTMDHHKNNTVNIWGEFIA